MSQPNELYAYFTVTGEFNPEEVTRRLGVVPTDSWKKGDLHPRTGLERKFSRWCLYSRLARSEELETHVADVLAQMDNNPEAFVAVSKEYGGHMQLVGYFHETYPGLFFEASLIGGLARYGLSVDFDFYHLWSDAREDT